MGTSETAPHARPGPLVSVVIPAYNESTRIGDSLAKIQSFFERQGYSYELLVIDDGSTDNTAALVERIPIPQLRVIRNGTNRGKGHSVQRGVLEARGEYVLLSDADLSAPIEELETLLVVARRENADIVIGSRAVDRSLIGARQSPMRESAGKLFNVAVRLILGLKIHDTQCGFKLFRRECVVGIFAKVTTPGFGFDPEVLYLASRRNLKTFEIPVRWNHVEGSTIHVFRDGVGMFLDIIRIRWNDRRGRYL